MVVWLVLSSIILSKIFGMFFFARFRICYKLVINIDYSDSGKCILHWLLIFCSTIFLFWLVSEPGIF